MPKNRSWCAWLSGLVFIMSFFAGLFMAHQAALASQESFVLQQAAGEELAGAVVSLERAGTSVASIPRLTVIEKYGAMEKVLAGLTDDSAGNFSIGFYDLKNDYKYIVHPEAMPAASVIKLYIMIEAYRQARDGEIDLLEQHILEDDQKTEGSGVMAGYPAGTAFTLTGLVEMMIIDSDNTAANILIERLGKDKINHTIKSLGCHDTMLKWKLMTDEILIGGDDNPVSCPDLILTLRKMYAGECIGPEYDQEMIAIMTRQHYRSRIPAGVPAGTKIANKTGTLSGVVNDTAIVYTDKGDYILCVLNSNMPDNDQAEATIAAVSKTVYQAFITEPHDEANLDRR